jgi:glycosyltransferase involved in cell wall biosynthesis
MPAPAETKEKPANKSQVKPAAKTQSAAEVLVRCLENEGVEYIYIDHGGPARARNAGMQRARGEYLCYLDSDDLYYPHKLALQVDWLDRHPECVMVYTEFSAFDGQGMWVYVLPDSNGGDVDSIALDARARGVTTLVVKAGDGTRYWPQFSRELVDALHARGLKVCGYGRIFSRKPVTEARVSARAVTEAGADCFVVDAEKEYEGRYTQARRYVRELRRLVKLT